MGVSRGDSENTRAQDPNSEGTQLPGLVMGWVTVLVPGTSSLVALRHTPQGLRAWPGVCSVDESIGTTQEPGRKAESQASPVICWTRT